LKAALGDDGQRGSELFQSRNIKLIGTER